MVETSLSFDMAGAIEALESFGLQAKQHLPRSMAVAGGSVIRDEAKARAPVYDGSTGLPFGRNATDPPTPGALREAIYLAFRDAQSDPGRGLAVYSVSWNAAKAPHGHLLEFGHWRYNRIGGGYPQKSLGKSARRGRGSGSHTGPGALPEPVWVSAQPFLRPAYDAAVQSAVRAMMDRGRERTAELIAEARNA